MKRTNGLLGLVVAVCLVGCQFTAVPGGDNKPGPKPSTKETVWTVVADYVDSGDVTDTTKLELMVKRLRSRGSIDDSAVEKFYAAFPGSKDKELPVSKDDSAKLRAIQ